MRKIILASASPRRRDLLRQAGLDFEVCPSDAEENIEKREEYAGMPVRRFKDLTESEDAYALARGVALGDEFAAAAVRRASAKASDIAARHLTVDDPRIVLGADTVVVFGGQILGKPENDAAAAQTLRLLGGHTHQVYTGVCLVENHGGSLCPHTFYEKTDVTMYEMTEEEISWYVSTGEPADKAGAYGIQGIGGVFVRAIAGDYYNVVGLPLAGVWHYLKGRCFDGQQ